MAKLDLSLFINRQHLPHENEDLFTAPFQFLAGGAQAWIESLLTKEGVGPVPVVLGDVSPHAILEGRVYVGKGAKIGPFAYIQGPTYIGAGSEVRHGAFIRGNCYLGQKAVVGHSTEVKNALFCNGAKAAHFAYVGDSILGHEVNLGAGTKLANVKVKRGNIQITHPISGDKIDTKLHKMGAILGDFAQTGCNAVLSPGTLLYPHTMVYPCVHYHGTLTKGSVKTNERP